MKEKAMYTWFFRWTSDEEFRNLDSIKIIETIKLSDEFIKHGHALKAAGLVGSGVEAKEVITEGLVKVNGEVDTRRGKKLYDGDVVTFNGEEIKIEK